MDDWVYHEWHKLLLSPLKQHFRYGTIPVKPIACDFETVVISQPLLASSIIPRSNKQLSKLLTCSTF